MDGIGIGEDVVGRLPIGMLVGGPEACQPERRRIGEGTAEIGNSSARPDRSPRIDAMILPHDANLRRMEFSERTGSNFRERQR